MAKPIVYFSVGDDQAQHVHDVLAAAGYDPVRRLTFAEQRDAIIERVSAESKLSPRQREVFAAVVSGKSRDEIATDFNISLATVKWHMHAVFARTRTGRREQLLRLVFDQLVNQETT